METEKTDQNQHQNPQIPVENIIEKFQKEIKEIEDSELEVGISEYLNPGKQILGISKYRISDFIVNEIPINQKEPVFYNKSALQKQYDNIVQQEQQKKEQQVQENQAEKKLADGYEKLVAEKIGEENTKELVKFYDDWNSGEKKSFFELQFPAPESKEERRAIHEFVRENIPYFDSQLQDNKIILKFIKNQAKKQKFVSRDPSQKCYIFTLHKNNVDTNNALSQLAAYLRMPNKSFGQAGIKDKRGYTTQNITLNCFKVPLEGIVKALYKYKPNNMNFGEIKYASQVLRTGDLYGNRFSVALRLLKQEEDVIKQNIENLAKDGFINFYGMQRFGNNLTHLVGRQILKGQYKEAFETILYGQKNNRFAPLLEEFRETLDADTALKRLPRFLKIERTLIYAWKKYGSASMLTCIQQLPKSMRDLYPHAYQSYLWNKLASIRIQKYGNKLAIGDIVPKNKEILEQLQQDDDDLQNDDDDENNKKNNINKNQNQNNEEQKQEQPKYKGINDVEITYIDENNINDYSMKDVLIPIFGGDLKIDYQKFNIGQDMLNILKDDGVTLERIIDLQKNFSLSGGFRTLLFTAENVDYKIIKFNELDEDFLTPYYNEEQDKNNPNGKYSALVARFTLKKGCYATMLMRELTKVSSAFDIQMKLNDLYKTLQTEKKTENQEDQQDTSASQNQENKLSEKQQQVQEQEQQKE